MNIEQEKKEIEKTIQFLFDGFDNLDAELIIKAFYSDKAEMFSLKKTVPRINKTPVSDWVEMCEKAKKQPDNIWNKEKSEKNIVYIDITERAAQAKVEYIFSTYKYTDYYNLLKVGSQWVITNKTFETTLFK
jgi:hypothetical protein